MSAITVRHHEGDQFIATARGHSFMVDQPAADGGTDLAPTPTELFVASYASCVAFYAHRYLVRHGLPTQGLAATASYTIATRPVRLATIEVYLDLPHGLPSERREALLAVASHCTLHNTLADPPKLSVSLVAETAAA